MKNFSHSVQITFHLVSRSKLVIVSKGDRPFSHHTSLRSHRKLAELRIRNCWGCCDVNRRGALISLLLHHLNSLDGLHMLFRAAKVGVLKGLEEI